MDMLLIAAATSTAMTAGGGVDWSDPWLTPSQIVAWFVGMAVGAALGDLLPKSERTRPE
jgi:hypothetical protein